jgi:hypothetical protein
LVGDLLVGQRSRKFVCDNCDKEYGRDSLLGLINPLMTFFISGARRATARSNYQARLIERMEDDSVEMRGLGYRVVSSREYERPALGITYFRVTYELVEPPK